MYTEKGADNSNTNNCSLRRSQLVPYGILLVVIQYLKKHLVKENSDGFVSQWHNFLMH